MSPAARSAETHADASSLAARCLAGGCVTTRSRYMLVQYVTFVRIPLAATAGVLLHRAAPGDLLALVVVALLGVCELTDIFDGLLARRLGAESRFGALFDPYCDSMSRLIIFFGLASRGLCPWWLFLLMSLRDVSVAYIRIMYILSGKRPGARLSGKAKAWAQGLGAIALAALWAFGAMPLNDFRLGRHWLPTTIVALIAAITLWSLLDYFGAAQVPPAPQKDSPGS